MIKLMELALFIFLMEGNILGHGRMIFNTDLELKLGLIQPNMKVDLKMDKGIVLELFISLMEVNMLVSFIIIKYKGRELMNGKTDANLKVSGKKVK